MPRLRHVLLLLAWLGGLVGPLTAKELVLATSNGPPHMIQADHSGIDIDIVRAVLQRLGYDLKLQYLPLARAKKMVKLGFFDATTPTFAESDSPGFYVSAPIVDYRPTVFTLRKHDYQINAIADLRGHSILTFQGARGYFGPRFVEVAATTSYKELADMSKFPRLLLRDRFSVVVLDYYIFLYFYRQQDKNRSLAPFVLHDIIPPVTAGVGFHDRALRDSFDQALAGFIAEGGHLSIIEKYIGKGIH